MSKGYVAANLKELNRQAVYNLLRSQGEISKAEIGRITGISAPTVGKIIDYFKAIGIVSEGGEGVSTLGRKPQLLRYTPNAVYAIGAGFDGIHLQIGIVDLAGCLAAASTVRIDHDIRSLLTTAFLPAVRSVIDGSGIPADRIVGLGLGLPGVVDSDSAGKKILRYAPFVGVEKEYALHDDLAYLESALGMPVLVENDANAAALGEFAERGLCDTDDLLYVEVGRGLGSGLILNGRLRKGAASFAGELGYLVYDAKFKAVTGQPGWLESKLALGEFWAEVGRDGQPSAPSLARVADYVSIAVANVCVSLDLRNAVIGGAGLAPFGPALISAVGEGLKRISVIDVRCEAPAAPAPGISGAAGLAASGWLERVFAG